ncbi:MAG: ATP-binding protein [Fusobacterium sp.]|nr:ATP-binding protein [Fusobacterium sp.]
MNDSFDVIQDTNITFDDVGGMEELKEEIQLNIIYPFKNPDLYIQYGKKAGGGILMYGPPGCGKTYIAKATANECEATFINISLVDVLDMYVGESERKLHEIFNLARRKAPAVIFIDEIDALGNDRMKTGTNVQARTLVNQFLTELDGVASNNHQIMILGSTNVPWFVDTALKRPGRFDKTLFVPPPEIKAREEIFKLNLVGKPIAQIDYERLARETEEFSPADIVGVCSVAIDNIIRKAIKTGQKDLITTEALLQAISEVKPSTIEWFETAKNYVKYSNQSGHYDDVMHYLNRK